MSGTNDGNIGKFRLICFDLLKERGGIRPKDATKLRDIAFKMGLTNIEIEEFKSSIFDWVLKSMLDAGWPEDLARQQANRTKEEIKKI